jgi:hypothetical protein
MTYDLRRLRLHHLIERVEGHCSRLTPDGQRFALFYSKLGDRVIPSLFASHQPNSPPKLRRALAVVDHCVRGYLEHAGLLRAA